MGKVANSWGTGHFNGGSLTAKWIPFAEGGFFKIKRGTNFCGIEASICYAAAVHLNHSAAVDNRQADFSHLGTTDLPGAYRELDNTNTIGVLMAKKHHVHTIQQHAMGRRSAGQVAL